MLRGNLHVDVSLTQVLDLLCLRSALASCQRRALTSAVVAILSEDRVCCVHIAS